LDAMAQLLASDQLKVGICHMYSVLGASTAALQDHLQYIGLLQLCVYQHCQCGVMPC
jgi:hypothetical protein